MKLGMQDIYNENRITTPSVLRFNVSLEGVFQGFAGTDFKDDGKPNSTAEYADWLDNEIRLVTDGKAFSVLKKSWRQFD